MSDSEAANDADVRVIVGAPIPAERTTDAASGAAPAQTNAVARGAPSAAALGDAPSQTTGASRDSSVSVDALVGQINGRPVFASEFLAPMDSRLRVEAGRMAPREWLEFARREISRELRSRVVNELLLAEARASLTPEQRKGLLAFIETFRESLVSKSAGSEELAERDIQAQEGRSLDEKAREMLDQELLRMQLRKALADHAQVSWREVELEYDRRREEFNPPPTVTIRMIRVPQQDADRIARIEQALEGGESFEAIARRESDWNPEGGGLYPRDGAFRLDAPSVAEASIFQPAPLNRAARTLAPGDRAGPIGYGGAVYWLFLERVEQSSTSLFDAQLDLLERLRARRLQEAEQRYLEDLIGRGSLTDIRRMEDRLFRFAAERYLLQGGS